MGDLISTHLDEGKREVITGKRSDGRVCLQDMIDNQFWYAKYGVAKGLLCGLRPVLGFWVKGFTFHPKK